MNMDMNTYTHTYKFRRDTTRRFSKNGFVLARVPPWACCLYMLYCMREYNA